MTKESLKRYSNIIFWVTTAFAVVTLIVVGKDYIAMVGTGVCPIAKYNGLIYTALGLLLGSIVVTSLLDSKAKIMEQKVEQTSIYDKTLETLKQETESKETLSSSDSDEGVGTAEKGNLDEEGSN